MINSATQNLIVEFEGLRLVAYQDGGGVWTIGIGHTSMAGEPKVYKGLTITKDQAYAILAKDIARTERQVQSLVKVPINNNQYGALVSFAFNVGSDIDEDKVAEGLGDSTLLRKLNAKDYKGAADEFLKWDHDNGEVVAGLTRRRKAERALFLKPTDASQTPVEPPIVSEPPKHGEALVDPAPVAKKKSLLEVLFDLFITAFKR